MSISNNPTQQQSRAIWQKSSHHSNTPSLHHSHIESWEEKGLSARRFTDQSTYTDRDHGDYYTTRQVALLFGCSPQSVNYLRKRRRLAGFRRPLKKNRYERRRWWFFLKEEVHALMNDPQY